MKVRNNTSWALLVAGVGILACAKQTSPAETPVEEEPSADGVPAAAPVAPQPAPAAEPQSADLSSDEEAERRQKVEATPKPAPKKASAPTRASAPEGLELEKDTQKGAVTLVSLQQATDEQLSSFRLFQDAITASTPNCGDAERFQKAVCRLAERICELEDQLVDSTGGHCSDGRQRCQQATREYNQRCK